MKVLLPDQIDYSRQRGSSRDEVLAWVRRFPWVVFYIKYVGSLQFVFTSNVDKPVMFLKSSVKREYAPGRPAHFDYWRNIYLVNQSGLLVTGSRTTEKNKA